MAVLAARWAGSLEAAATRFRHVADQNLRHVESQALHDAQARLRETTQRAARADADATPPRRCASGRARTFQTRFGDITVRRTRGDCKRCGKWRTEVDPIGWTTERRS